MLDFLRNNIYTGNIDYVSGGERRDWFFSLMGAKKLGKPHITIYKDMSAVITEDGETREAESISGARVLHIADLVTEASSYERAWIPAIKNICGRMTSTVVIVDRMQGGSELRSMAFAALQWYRSIKGFSIKPLNWGKSAGLNMICS